MKLQVGLGEGAPTRRRPKAVRRGRKVSGQLPPRGMAGLDLRRDAVEQEGATAAGDDDGVSSTASSVPALVRVCWVISPRIIHALRCLRRAVSGPAAAGKGSVVGVAVGRKVNWDRMAV